MSTRTADEGKRRKRPAGDALRLRGRRLFSSRVRDSSSIVAAILGELPSPVVELMASLCGAAFQMGYEAGWDESRNATDD